jgi:micrococcal nuclease
MSATDTARTPEPFVYRLKAVAKVVDGDTVGLDLDLGFSITLRQRVRFYGLDAPEIRSKDPAEKAKGQESQAFVSQWFERGGDVLVRTSKEEKYGRMLADCYREGEPSLCTELLERVLARPYLP